MKIRLVGMAVQTCADSIDELRKCDVFRVLDTAQANGSFKDTLAFVLENRPEFHQIVNEWVFDQDPEQM